LGVGFVGATGVAFGVVAVLPVPVVPIPGVTVVVPGVVAVAPVPVPLVSEPVPVGEHGALPLVPQPVGPGVPPGVAPGALPAELPLSDAGMPLGVLGTPVGDWVIPLGLVVPGVALWVGEVGAPLRPALPVCAHAVHPDNMNAAAVISSFLISFSPSTESEFGFVGRGAAHYDGRVTVPGCLADAFLRELRRIRS